MTTTVSDGRHRSSSWPVTVAEAAQLKARHRHRVKVGAGPRAVRLVAGADLAYRQDSRYRSGRGVYGMKALGSGQVTGKAAVASALRFAFCDPYAHSICLGITADAELETAVASWRRTADRTTRRAS